MSKTTTVRPSQSTSPRWRRGLHHATMRGVSAWWSVQIDKSEVARRASTRLSCMSRLDLLAVLLKLPLGESIEPSSLADRDRVMLASLPPQVVDWTPSGVARLARPVLSLSHTYISSRTFRGGLDAISDFGTYCARSVVLPSTASVQEFELAEAAYFGVGIYVYICGELKELATPEIFPELPETPASWAFSESLYNRL